MASQQPPKLFTYLNKYVFTANDAENLSTDVLHLHRSSRQMPSRYPSDPLLRYSARPCLHCQIRLHVRGRRFLATVSNFVGLPPPSPEQELVLRAVRQGRNARITAVAGSGKTTTILQVAQAFPERKILGIYSPRKCA